MLDGLLQDCKYATKVLWKNPGYSIVAAITLALGIGANTALFSIVNAVLLRDLPYSEPDEIVMVWLDNRIQGFHEDLTSYPYYRHLRDENTSLENLAAYRSAPMGLTGVGDPERITGASVSSTFFELLGVSPLHGRAFQQAEENAGGDRVAIVSYNLWSNRFGSRADITGQTVSLDGAPHSIVGVMPAGFDFPEGTDVWTPLAPPERLRNSYGSLWLYTLGRLRNGVNPSQAQADLDGIISRVSVEQVGVEPDGHGVTVNALHAQLVGDVRTALWVLSGAVGMVLLVACANVANLSLARAAAREGEMALRTALGAGGARLIRLLLVESVVLAVVGGVVGLLVAQVCLRAVLLLAPAELPRMDGVGLDSTVLLFTLAASIVSAVMFGLFPALRASRPDLQGSLRGAASSIAGGRSGLRRMLVIAEVSIAVVLLIGAGLLIKSFVRLNRVDVGFNPQGLISMRLTLPNSQYPEASDVRAFHAELKNELIGVPGIEGVGMGTSILIGTFPQSGTFAIEGRTLEPAEEVEVLIDSADPQLFPLLGVPLLRGRMFELSDGDGQNPVILINQTMANMFWPDQDPVGQRITFGNPSDDATWFTILGVVGDRRRAGLQSEPRPATFFAYEQFPSRTVDIIMSSPGEAGPLLPTIRRALWQLDANLPIAQLASVESLYQERAAGPRFNMTLLGLLAAVALAMAAAGVYGVTMHSVTERTRELGLRIALGAQGRDVVRMVLYRAFRMIGVGLLIGVAVAVLSGKVMSSLVYDVSATDPLTYVAVVSTLGLVGLAASLIPAVRAARLDSMSCLRE